ncbi:CBL-interacting serine/threonine-protein kinase 6-like [Quercus suber]
MDSFWFKKSAPKSILTKEEQKFQEYEKSPFKDSETLNAFHIILLSEGLDLSPLFEEKKVEEKEELRFATTRPTSSVISTLEEMAAKSGNFSVKKSESRVRLQGNECGRKGKLTIEAEIFAMTPSFLVVEVKKNYGDTLEYYQFCSKELRPALKDIFWISPTDNSALCSLE